MEQENKTIAFIQQLDYSTMTSKEISNKLAEFGYTGSNGENYSVAQINSLIHSVNSLFKRRQKRRVDTCGIDRKNNPCGDASDY